MKGSILVKAIIVTALGLVFLASSVFADHYTHRNVTPMECKVTWYKPDGSKEIFYTRQEPTRTRSGRSLKLVLKDGRQVILMHPTDVLIEELD